MLFEAPLLATLSRPHSSENDDMSTKRPRGRVDSPATAGKRRRASSIASPLKTLCFNQESSLGLDSIFNYLPAAPCSKRSSWNAASFKQFKSKPASTRPRSTTTSSTVASSPPPVTTSTTISSLPTELLCLIFDSYSTASPSPQDGTGDCAPDPESHPYGFFSVSRDYIRTPLPLTQVCQRWRSTAIAHKSLWNSIALALQGPEDEDEEESLQFQGWAHGKVQLLKLFLTRARGVPLRLQLSTSEETPVNVTSEVLKWICRQAGQWHEVRMDLCAVSAVQTLRDELSIRVARNVEATFGMLKSLHLELAVDDEDDEEEYDEERMLSSRLAVKDVYELILRRAPRLSELVLDYLFFIWAEAGDYAICPSYERRCTDDESSGEIVPWRQLKKLTINSNSISAREVLDICSKAGALEELKVWRVGCDRASDVDMWDLSADAHCAPTARVALPNLRSLELTLVADSAQLLGALSLPSLRRVDVDVQALQSPWHMHHQTPVASILAPLDNLLQPVADPIDVRCGIRSSCVSLEEGESMPSVVDSAWMESKGLRALARSRGRVEVYKYGSRRAV